MKKLLSMILVLVMVTSLVAIPAMAEVTGDYVYLPYKTETFTGYRNSLTSLGANLNLHVKHAVGVNSDRFPIFGDSAFAGVYTEVTTEEPYTTVDVQGDPDAKNALDVAIIADETSTSSGTGANMNISYSEKMLKFSGEGTGYKTVKFGFIPLEILSQVNGFYYKWDEKVADPAAGIRIIPQWVKADGSFETANSTEIHTITEQAATDSFGTVMVEFFGGKAYYNGTEAFDFDVADAPIDAVGISLSYQTDATESFEIYFKNLELGTIGGSVAALRGDTRYYSSTNNEVVIDFSAPVVEGAENIALYLDNVEVAEANYVWNAENTELTITAPDDLGTSKGYRVSTSKASTANGAIINDVRFVTTIQGKSAVIVAPNTIEIYDLNGNKLNTSAVVDGEDITITLYLDEGLQPPRVVVPSFRYVGSSTFYPDFFYNLVIGENDEFSALIRGAYPIVNGATAIPFKDFTLFQGVNANTQRHTTYNVTFEVEEIPAEVTAEITCDDDLSEVGLFTPVTVTFTNGISEEGQAAVEITEDGEEFTAYTTEWSADGTELVITPDSMWSLGAEYVITVPEDASIFGEMSTVVATDLVFTATTQVPDPSYIETFEITNDAIDFTFDAASRTIAVVVKTDGEAVDLTNVGFTATVSGIDGTTFEIDGTPVAISDGSVTGTLDISGANGKSNAVTISVDNGFGVPNEYDVYYISTTNPPVERVVFRTVETFEDATAGQSIKEGQNIIASSGYVTTPSSHVFTSDASKKATVVEENGNKFLNLVVGSAGGYTSFITTAIPKSFYRNAKKLYFSYDVRQAGGGSNSRGGVGGAANENDTVTFSGNSDLTGISLFAWGSQWATWFTSGSFTGRSTANANNVKPIIDTYAYVQNVEPTWQTVEWTLENVEIPVAADRIDEYEGKKGTRLSMKRKIKDSDTWTVASSGDEVAAWNFKNDEFLRFYVAHDMYSGSAVIGDYDNFTIYADVQDLATEITLESGSNIAVGEKVEVEFKTPLEPGMEGNFIFADYEGNEVGYDYTWSEDRLTLTLVPDVQPNKVYTLNSVGLKDVYDNEIVVGAEIPVLPDTEYEEFADDAEYTVIPGDYSQTLNIFYKHNLAGLQTADVEFIYGTKSATVEDVKISRPQEGENYALASVVIPEDVVRSGEETVKIEIGTEIDVEILGVYFVVGMDLEVINAATEENALDILWDIAEAVGEKDNFDKLVESEEDDFVQALLDRLDEGDFENVDEVKTWFAQQLEDALETNPNPDGDLDLDNDDNDDTTSSKETYPGGTDFTEDPVDKAPLIEKFTDLGEASWAKTAINTLYAAGIVNGVTENEYAPLKNVTREEFVKLIVVTFGIYDPYLNSSFVDVDKSAWYNPYIASAYQAGIVAGISNTEFGVGQSITREQMATMLKRACDKYGVSLDGNATTTFKDQNFISGYAAESVDALAKAGIINGIDGSFAPQDIANRAMAAQVVYLVYLKK